MSRLVFICGVLFLISFVFALPLNSDEETEETTEDNSSEDSEESRRSAEESSTIFNNETGQNLIIIKSIVYEIGILTDADNDTDASNETHEQIDFSFFDPGHNGSIINLSNIPIPIQTNISGVTVTGVLPVHFGSISFSGDGTPSLNGTTFPLLPNKQVRVTHNVSTTDRKKNSLILDSLSDFLGLDKASDYKTEDVKNNTENN